MNKDNIVYLSERRNSRALAALDRLTGLRWGVHPTSLLAFVKDDRRLMTIQKNNGEKKSA